MTDTREALASHDVAATNCADDVTACGSCAPTTGAACCGVTSALVAVALVSSAAVLVSRATAGADVITMLAIVSFTPGIDTLADDVTDDRPAGGPSGLEKAGSGEGAGTDVVGPALIAGSGEGAGTDVVGPALIAGMVKEPSEHRYQRKRMMTKLTIISH